MEFEIIALLGLLTLGLLSPGPDFLIVVRNSVGHARGHAMATVAGIAVGLGVQTALIALGVGALPGQAIRAIALAGAAFLAWLGVRALLAPAPAGSETVLRSAGSQGRSGFMEGLVCNLTNPKAFLFFVGVFAQFLRPSSPPVWRIALPVVIVGHGLVMWSLVVLALQSGPVARKLARAQHWLPRCFGLALLGFAALILFETLGR
jgi:threonine/homoserine/homoserine lactone efflux protein